MNRSSAVTGMDDIKTELLYPAPSAGTLLPAHSRPDPVGSRSRAGGGDFTASLRVPARKENREYLRALRAAELAAWEQAGRATPRRQATGSVARFELRSPGEVRGQRLEAALYALLAAGSLMAGLASARAGLELVARWSLVVEAVRTALT